MMCTNINKSNDQNTSLFIWNIYPNLTHAGDDRFLYTNLLRLPVHSLLTAIFQGRLQNGFRSRRYCWLSSWITLQRNAEYPVTGRIFNSLLDCSLGYSVWSETYNIRSGSRSVLYSSLIFHSTHNAFIYCKQKASRTLSPIIFIVFWEECSVWPALDFKVLDLLSITWKIFFIDVIQDIFEETKGKRIQVKD